MCGIVGYVGPREAAPILMEGLRRMEYRGYDSAGIAIVNGNGLTVRKAAGKLRVLSGELGDVSAPHGTLGIGHTRWATHGAPTTPNAHPHTDMSGRIALIHNGMIENASDLRKALLARGSGNRRNNLLNLPIRLPPRFGSLLQNPPFAPRQ